MSPVRPGPPPLTYEVCRSAETLDRLRRADWTVEELPVSEAFAAVHPAVRAALGRLYGGQRLRVARGWTTGDTYVEAITLVAPSPADTLDSVVPGTLIIRARHQRDASRVTPSAP